MSLDSDLEWAYAQTEDTVSVVYGAQETRGYLDKFDQELTGVGDVSERRILLQVRAGSLVNVANESAIVAGGGNYQIRDKQLINDGKELRLYLVEA
ncbi:MAG: hypothetical protein WEA80_01850 [Gemmatimonadaceae bacterium]